MDLDNDRTGRYGEDLLRAWASAVDISPTKTDVDRHGWDFLLEFEDSSGTQATALVQVKASVRAARRVSVSLANWKRLVENPLPCFFLVIHLDEKSREVDGAFLVHVDRQHISSVLEALDEPHPTDPPKRTRDLVCKDHNRLTPESATNKAHGTALLDALREGLGGSALQYTRGKIEYLDRVGLGERPHRVRVRSKWDAESQRGLAELAVGLRDEIPISVLGHELVRFGRARPCEPADSPAGREGLMLSFPEVPPWGKAVVRVSEDGGGRFAELEAPLWFSARVFPFLPSDSHIGHVRGALISVVTSAGKMELRFEHPSNPIPLRDLEQEAQFVLLLSEGTPPLALTVEFRDYVIKHEVQPIRLPEPMRTVCRTAVCAAYLGRKFGVAGTEAVEPQLMVAHAENLLALQEALQGSSSPTATASGEALAELDGTRVAFLMQVAVPIGSKAVAIVLGIVGVGKFEDDVLSTSADGAPFIVESVINSASLTTFDWDPLVKEAKRRAKEVGATAIVGPPKA